jgi:hypothetical protein
MRGTVVAASVVMVCLWAAVGEASRAMADVGDAPRADAVEALTNENRALRAQVEQLQRENAELRRKLGVAEVQTEDLAAENRRLETLAGVTAKGERVESAAALIRSESRGGQTVVATSPERLDSVSGILEVPHSAWFEYAYAGDAMNERPQTVSLFITASGNSRPKYRTVRELSVTIDGEATRWPVADYSATSRGSAASQVGARRHTETIRFDLDDATLRRLARARHVEASLANVQITLPAEVIATARAVRERIDMGL